MRRLGNEMYWLFNILRILILDTGKTDNTGNTGNSCNSGVHGLDYFPCNATNIYKTYRGRLVINITIVILCKRFR